MNTAAVIGRGTAQIVYRRAVGTPADRIAVINACTIFRQRYFIFFTRPENKRR
jgi:hypothetical protein